MPILSTRWAEYPWKNELQLQAERVLEHMAEALDEDSQEEHRPMDMLERAITLAAFSMRRMIEKRLVTDALVACTSTSRAFRQRPKASVRRSMVRLGGEPTRIIISTNRRSSA